MFFMYVLYSNYCFFLHSLLLGTLFRVESTYLAYMHFIFISCSIHVQFNSIDFQQSAAINSTRKHQRHRFQPPPPSPPLRLYPAKVKGSIFFWNDSFGG